MVRGAIPTQRGPARRADPDTAGEAGSVSARPPQGFLFSAGTAGIKASGKPDLALALAPDGASAAAMFTRNQVVAAPVTVGREICAADRG